MEEKDLGGKMMQAAWSVLLIGIIVFVLFSFMLELFFEPGKSSIVFHAQADMRSLATALEAYRVDHEAYPPGMMMRDLAAQSKELKESRLQGANGRDLQTLSPLLTTPVSYITTIPWQPEYGKANFKLPFAYHGNDRAYILFASGPDNFYDFQPEPDFMETRDADAIREFCMLLTFDPTNGTKCSGDLFRFSLDALEKDKDEKTEAE